MKYGRDDRDILEHIAKIKQYLWDLILMGCDLPDEVFVCFLRLSMPLEWNYIFARLMDPYMSCEVET